MNLFHFLWKKWSEFRPLQDWNEFWFREQNLTAVGVFRIALGLTCLMKLALLLPFLGDYFSETGMLTLEQSLRVAYPPRLCIFDYLPLDVAPIVVWALILFSIAFTFGLQTRLMTALLFVGMLSLDYRNSWVTNSGDRLLSLMLFFGIFAPMGASLSLDRMIGIFRGKLSFVPAVGPYWAIRLMQIQVCMMYFWSAFIKAKGQSWPGGDAIYWVSKNLERARWPLPPLIGTTMIGLNMLAYFTLFTEGFFPFMVWSKRTRGYIIIAGLLLHLGIEQSMTVQVFSYVVFCGYILFYYGEEVQTAWERFRKRFFTASPTPVFFDGDCGFCTRSVNVVRAMDIFHKLDIQNFRIPGLKEIYPDLDPERNELELTLKTHSGKWYGGFYAFRWMSWRLPTIWLLAPFLYLPGVSWLGDKAYKWIASHRMLLAGGGTACALPTTPASSDASTDETSPDEHEPVSAGKAGE